MHSAPQPAPSPRGVDAGRGVAWWTEAWALLMRNLGMWVVLSLVSLVLFIVLNFVPLIGALAASLLAPVFVGGWMLAARKVQAGGTLEVGDLFLGFREALTPLAILGALLLGAVLVIGIVFSVLGIGAMAGMIGGTMHGSPGGMMAAAGTGLFGLLLAFVLGVAVSIAIWFAPALVVFHGLAPVDALKASIQASLKNIGPFLVYGLLYIVAAMVASIPFGLGWIVLVPLTLLSVYTSYQDVFGA